MRPKVVHFYVMNLGVLNHGILSPNIILFPVIGYLIWTVNKTCNPVEISKAEVIEY